MVIDFAPITVTAAACDAAPSASSDAMAKATVDSFMMKSPPTDESAVTAVSEPAVGYDAFPSPGIGTSQRVQNRSGGWSLNERGHAVAPGWPIRPVGGAALIPSREREGRGCR